MNITISSDDPTPVNPDDIERIAKVLAALEHKPEPTKFHRSLAKVSLGLAQQLNIAEPEANIDAVGLAISLASIMALPQGGEVLVTTKAA